MEYTWFPSRHTRTRRTKALVGRRVREGGRCAGKGPFDLILTGSYSIV